MNNTLDYLTALYYTLKQMKGMCFKPEDYKWRLGSKVIRDIGLREFNIFIGNEKPAMLFGISVEVDTFNPDNVQIFEDITNKIYIDKGADNDTSREES